MHELYSEQKTSGKVVVATIANQKNPGQVVEIVHLPEKAIFLTRGISTHFHLKEIAVPQDLMIANIQTLTGVLSYLLDRIATAADLSLPFRYEPEFKLDDQRYRLEERGDYMVLTPMEEPFSPQR